MRAMLLLGCVREAGALDEYGRLEQTHTHKWEDGEREKGVMDGD